MTSQALRVLAFAERREVEEVEGYDGPTHPAHRLVEDPTVYVEMERGLTFVGMVGLQVGGWGESEGWDGCGGFRLDSHEF